jgi:hypothetical protein
MEGGADDGGPCQTKTLVTTIKCALPGVLALSGAACSTFEAFVEDQVRVTSIRMRRASLVMLYHFTKMAQAGQRIPNLFTANLTYWKNAVELHPARLPIDLAKSGHLCEIEALVGPPLGGMHGNQSPGHIRWKPSHDRMKGARP